MKNYIRTVKATKTVKSNFSLYGYDFLTWLRDNVVLIKNVTKYVGPYILAQAFFTNNPVIAFAAAGLSAWALSVLEYWAKSITTFKA